MAIALILGSAACSSTPTGPKVATLGGEGVAAAAASDGGAGGASSFEDALVDYSRCMRDHGVDMPDPTFEDGGTGGKVGIVSGPVGASSFDGASDELGPAQEACGPILDRAHQDMPRPSAEEAARMRDQALAFARCMREQGVDMPDPTFGADGSIAIQVAGTPPAGRDDDPAEGGADGQRDDGPGTSMAPGAAVGATPFSDPKFNEAAQACESEGGGPFSLREDIVGDGGGQ